MLPKRDEEGEDEGEPHRPMDVCSVPCHWRLAAAVLGSYRPTGWNPEPYFSFCLALLRLGPGVAASSHFSQPPCGLWWDRVPLGVPSTEKTVRRSMQREPPPAEPLRR